MRTNELRAREMQRIVLAAWLAKTQTRNAEDCLTPSPPGLRPCCSADAYPTDVVDRTTSARTSVTAKIGTTRFDIVMTKASRQSARFLS